MARRGERGRSGTSAVKSAAGASDLYVKHGERVYGFCLARLGNREEAADAVQDTFLRAWLALRRGADIERPLPWLLTIADNVCVSRFRARRSRVTEAELSDAGTVGAAELDVAIDDLTAALRALPANQRRAFLRRELQGYSYDEIVADLGVSRASVTALLHRARRALARNLGDAGRRAAPAIVPLPQLLRAAFVSGPAPVAAATTAAVLALPQLALPTTPHPTSRPDRPSALSPTAYVVRVPAAATSIGAVRPATPNPGVRPSTSAMAISRRAISRSSILNTSSATEAAAMIPADGPFAPEPDVGGAPPSGPQNLPEDVPGNEPPDQPPDGQNPPEQPGSPYHLPPDEEDSPQSGPPDQPPHGKGPPEQPGSQGNGPPEAPGSQGNGPPDSASQGSGGPPEQPGSQGNGPPDVPGSQGNGPPDHASENEPPGQSGSVPGGPPDLPEPKGNEPADHASHGNGSSEP